MIIANLTQNAATAQRVIAGAVDRLPYERSCECASALKFALITRPEVIPAQVRRDLAPIVGKYLQSTQTEEPS
jgi:5'-methylthioadenosine phosphorylase